MFYTAYESLWLFLIYSFLGWLAETALAAARKGRFLNRGFLSLPFSPIYGCGWLLFSIFLPELKSAPFFLFLGGAILATALEFVAGTLLEKATGRKWWDYSDCRWQFEGHICLPYALIWGLCALASLFIADRMLLRLVALIPKGAGRIILLVVGVLLALDALSSMAAILHAQGKRRGNLWPRLRRLTDRLDNALTRWVQRRLRSAYPNLDREPVVSLEERERPAVFAQGLCFYKVVGIFLSAAFLGDLTEMVFCRITAGRWMSRSSVLFGQFSIVWGLGAVMLTVVLYKYRSRSDGFLFTLGTVLGGAYEYGCSVFTELAFGTVFWDYSGLPFNLGGRINLLYCFFWGIASVVWLKLIYPRLSALIQRIPMRAGTVLTWVMVAFMAVNIVLSGMALGRYSQRQTETVPPESGVAQLLDRFFPDSRIQAVYPNLQMVEP